MTALAVHAIVYVAVNVFLVLVWLLTMGSLDEMREQLADPSTAIGASFWPIWSIAGWGLVLAIHAGTAAVLLPRRLARRARRRREAQTTAAPITGRHWVAVVFTDIVGSTELAEALGDERWAAELAAHRRVVRELIGRHGGTEIGTQGDGFFVRFESPTDAIGCAVALQSTLEGSDLQLRVGVHAGEAVGQDDNDLVGRVVNVASRVTDAAGPGEILITEAVADHLHTAVPVSDRGVRELKGTARPRHLFAIDWEHASDVAVIDE